MTVLATLHGVPLRGVEFDVTADLIAVVLVLTVVALIAIDMCRSR